MVMVRIVRISVSLSVNIVRVWVRHRVRIRISVSANMLELGMENSTCPVYLSVPDGKQESVRPRWPYDMRPCRKVHVCHCNSLGGAT